MIGTITALPFPKNDYGHYRVELTGRHLTGPEEFQLLYGKEGESRESIEDTLLAWHSQSYNALHLLEEGRVYQLVLIPNKELRDLKGQELVSYPYQERFGYVKGKKENFFVPAGLQLRLHELLSAEMMTDMGIHHVSLIHGKLVDAKGHERALCSRLYPQGLDLSATGAHNNTEYSDPGLIAFWIPD